ncbi:uncharacterized protein Tco025E_02747 [Trypanosoma conorhini]|uniref:Uncharacterized protein n=1 Tax=Trypanosoma conorhini TaxID=83891 RepID=A0A422Q1J1_9TRYP|nr:uncharacterized protein Tco025E_02747 [Trypanosoma conorhini]RNF23647.1 hypothetical protein Tco025E_02747 [Trypanosoma conorhini]
MEEPTDAPAREAEGLQPLTAAEAAAPSDAVAHDAGVGAETPASPGNADGDDVAVAALDEEAAAAAPAEESGDGVRRQRAALETAPGGGIVAEANAEMSLSTDVVTYARVYETLEDERECLAEVESVLQEVYEAEKARYEIEGSLSPDTTEEESDESDDFLYYEESDDSALQGIEDEELDLPAALETHETPALTEPASPASSDGDGRREVSQESKQKTYGPKRPHISVKKGPDGRLYARFMPLTEAVVRSAWGEVVRRRDAQLEAELLPEDCRTVRTRPGVRTASVAAAAAAAHPRSPLPLAPARALPPPGESAPRTAALPHLQRAVRRARLEALQRTCERIRPAAARTPPPGRGAAEAVDAVTTLPSILATARPAAARTTQGAGACATPTSSLSYASGWDVLPRAWRTVLPRLGGATAPTPHAQGNVKLDAKPACDPGAMASAAAVSAVQLDVKNNLAAEQPRTDRRSTSVVTLPRMSDAGDLALPAVINASPYSPARKQEAAASSAPLMQISPAFSQSRTFRRGSYSVPRPSLPPSLLTTGGGRLSCSLPMYSAAEQTLEETRDRLERVQDIIEDVYDEYINSKADVHEM